MLFYFKILFVILLMHLGSLFSFETSLNPFQCKSSLYNTGSLSATSGRDFLFNNKITQNAERWFR